MLDFDRELILSSVVRSIIVIVAEISNVQLSNHVE